MRLNTTIGALKSSMDALAAKFGNLGQGTPGAVDKISASMAGLQSSTATSTVTVQGLGAEFSTLEAEMARAIALSESGFSRMGVDIDAATKKLKEHNEELKTTALERAKDHFNQKYMGLSKEDKDNSNPRTAGAAIGSAIQNIASDPTNAAINGAAGIADIIGSTINPFVGELAKSITKLGLSALVGVSQENYAARATAMGFQANTNLSSDEVSLYGERIKASQLNAHYNNVASTEDVGAVYKSFAQHGAKPEEVFSQSENGIKGFGGTVAETSLGIDKALSLSAGSSARFAQELRQNMNVSLDESLGLLKKMGDAADHTSMGTEAFVGTILQASSALRVQGSDTEELTSQLLKYQEAAGGANSPNAGAKAAQALQSSAQTSQNMQRGMQLEVGKRLGFGENEDQILNAFRTGLYQTGARKGQKIEHMSDQVTSETYKFAKDLALKSGGTEDAIRNHTAMYLKDKMSWDNNQINVLEDADKKNLLNAKFDLNDYASKYEDAAKTQENQVPGYEKFAKEAIQRPFAHPAEASKRFVESLDRRAKKMAKVLVGIEFADQDFDDLHNSDLVPPKLNPVALPAPAPAPAPAPQVNTNTHASNAQTHTQEYAEFNVSVHQPAPIIQITRNTKSSKKVKEGYTIG